MNICCAKPWFFSLSWTILIFLFTNFSINIHTSGSTKTLVFVFHTSHFHVCLKIFILWILVPLFRLFLVLHRWTPPARGNQNHDWNGNPRDPFPAIHLQQRHHGIFIVTSFLKMKEEADKECGNWFFSKKGRQTLFPWTAFEEKNTLKSGPSRPVF